MVAILRDAGLSGLVDGGEGWKTLADGFQFTEGPLWFPDDSLLVQDIKAEVTYRLRPGRPPEVVRERTGAANGQTFLPDGRVIFCEQTGRRVSRMNPDGSGVETVAETWSGGRLNSPNDVVCRADGLAVFTDPPYGVAPADRALHFQGVYALDPTGGGPRLLADDFEKPNGVAFDPSGRTLYVCDTARYLVRVFEVDAAGGRVAGSDRVFARVDPDTPGGPDGIKVDREGRVYVAVAQGVWVYDPGGTLLGILGLPERPSNLAWCGADGSRLAATAVGAVHQIRLKVAGLLPPFLPSA